MRLTDEKSVEHFTAITPEKHCIWGLSVRHVWFSWLIFLKLWRDLIFFIEATFAFLIFFCKTDVLNSPTYCVKHFQSLTDTSEPQWEDNAISHNTLWYQIRSHQRFMLCESHSSFISYLKRHHNTAGLSINFPALQTRPSFLIVTLTTSRPFMGKQLILPMLTTLLGKNTMLAWG